MDMYVPLPLSIAKQKAWMEHSLRSESEGVVDREDRTRDAGADDDKLVKALKVQVLLSCSVLAAGGRAACAV